MKAELTLPERPATVHLLAVLDVLVLMLVFFVLLTSITQEAGVSVGLAETGFRLKNYEEPIVVTARGAVHPVLYVNTQSVSLEGFPEALRKAVEETGSESMFVRADERLPVGIERQIIEAGLKQGLDVALVGSREDGKAGATEPAASASERTEQPRSND